MVHRTTLVASLLLLLPAAALAQRPDIGFDAVAQFRLDDNDFTKYTQITVPGGGFIPSASFRINIPASPMIGIEPAIGLAYFSEGGEKLTTFEAMLGLLINFQTDPERAMIYVRPFGLFDFFDVDDESETQFGLGGGLGVRIPVDDRLGFRLEGNYSHLFESGSLSTRDVIGIRAGLSVFLK